MAAGYDTGSYPGEYQEIGQHQEYRPQGGSVSITTDKGNTVCMPITFVASHSSSCTQEQQDMMAHAITTMDDLEQDTIGSTPLTASSIVVFLVLW
jgi:hypothetical protein